MGEVLDIETEHYYNVVVIHLRPSFVEELFAREGMTHKLQKFHQVQQEGGFRRMW